MATIVSQWGEHGAPPASLGANAELFAQLVVRLGTDVDCTPMEAWALVADVTRIGEFSSECVSARWIGNHHGPSVGTQFEGTNRKLVGDDELIWVRRCTVVAADPARTFGFVVGDRYDGSPASHWRYRFRSTSPKRCRIELTFRHLRDGQSGLRLRADANPRHAANIIALRTEDLEQGMRTSLDRMRLTLET